MSVSANPADDYVRVSHMLAELERDGLYIPTDKTVRRWAQKGLIRAVYVGADRLLVSREDVRRMVTPTATPVAGGAA